MTTSTVRITSSPVSHAPSRADERISAHPITGQLMASWSPARRTREEDRRETVLSGRIAASDLGPAGRAYARELVMAGDCGYRSAIKQAEVLFRNW